MIVAVFNHVQSAPQGLLLTLGQSARATRATSDLWFYLSALTVCFVVIVAAGLIARRYLAGPIESSDGEAMFDLSELRRLHREGRLTDEEYLAARGAVLNDGNAYLGEAGSQTSPHAATPTGPPAGAGITLGPELLDSPHTPGDGPAEPDNTDPDPRTDGSGPRD
jgi:hypothetical protein